MTALSMSGVAAQSASAIPEPNATEEPIEEITVDRESGFCATSGSMCRRRESVYGLFNSLNTNEEFDIHCSTGARTGTRIGAASLQTTVH